MAEIILSLIRPPNASPTLCKTGSQGFAQLSTSEAHWSTTKSDGMWKCFAYERVHRPGGSRQGFLTGLASVNLVPVSAACPAWPRPMWCRSGRWRLPQQNGSSICESLNLRRLSTSDDTFHRGDSSGSLIFLTVFNICQRFEITEFLKADGLSALCLFGPVDPSVCGSVTVR